MKKLLIILSFNFGIGGGSGAFAGEITDTEWFMEFLTVTYFSGTSDIVNCTAFNSEKKPIGGGLAPSMGGVARVQIQVPKKYAGKSLKVACE